MIKTNTNVSTGPLTGILKPKYKMISTILGELYDVPNGLDVFIDFNTFIASLAGYAKFLQYMPFADGSDIETDLVSSIITTFSHWKNFTRKWDNVRIFGIYNDFEMGRLCESTQLKSYLIPYQNKFQNDKYKQMVYYFNEASKAVQTILKYVPNMYLIGCKSFDSLVLPNILDDYQSRKRIVISSSHFMTAYHMEPNTKVIYSRFRRNGPSQLSDPLSIVKSISKVDEDIMDEFTKNKVFYNLLNVIVGDFERGIVGLTQRGITSFGYDLLRGVEKHKIVSDPKSIEACLPVIDSCFHSYVLSSYPLVDISSHTNMIPKSQVEKLKSNMVDLIDIDGLHNITIDGLNLLELL